MAMRFGLRGQIILVVVLFAASLAVLLSSSLAALWMPARQAQTQNRLLNASRQMADEAAPLIEKLRADWKKPPHDLSHWRERLTDITRRALEDCPGVEGGFYMDGERWGFAGHAYPNDPHAPPQPPQDSKHSPQSERPRPAPPPDPPPKERDFILAQCQASLTAEQPIVQITEIPPSRILVVSEAVIAPRSSAWVSTWVMMRLSSPEQLAADVHRTQAATILALAGIIAALILSLTLGRNLRSERRQREQLREELRRAEHLAALGKLLAGVAHEVRNPLAAIRSTAQLWQRLPPAARDPSAMDAIVCGVDRLNDLVSRLLYFVRSGHEEHRPVDVNAIVQETLTLLRAQAETQRVAVHTELAADLPAISGSLQALQQVVLNLMNNALQAMPDGGTLACRTRRSPSPPTPLPLYSGGEGRKWPPSPPEYRGRGVGGEGGVELRIADTGPGIAAEDLPHLFEPFHTTRPQGTGLGLALCREIVQQHGGHIEWQRQEGWGAVFVVTLPIQENN